MNLEQYEKLTGKTVPDNQKAFITQQIKRSVGQLEALLGYTLDRNKTNTNIYNEKGKATSIYGWSYPDVDITTLLPPDEVIGSYRLFRFDVLDDFIATDPFTNVYAVKLVYVKEGVQGGEDNGITFRTFDVNEVRPQILFDGIGKYLQRMYPWKFIFHNTIVDKKLQLAVDADWLFEDCLPDALKYLIVDMVESHMDRRHNLQMESIDGHIYRKFKPVYAEQEPVNLSIIMDYAGPYSSLRRPVTL